MTRTEMSIEGANCPWCFNETIDCLRAEPGVEAVAGSLTDQCLLIDHDDIDVDSLLSLVAAHLHAEEVWATEHVMVQVKPHPTDLCCTARTAVTASV